MRRTSMIALAMLDSQSRFWEGRLFSKAQYFLSEAQHFLSEAQHFLSEAAWCLPLASYLFLRSFSVESRAPPFSVRGVDWRLTWAFQQTRVSEHCLQKHLKTLVLYEHTHLHSVMIGNGIFNCTNEGGTRMLTSASSSTSDVAPVVMVATERPSSATVDAINEASSMLTVATGYCVRAFFYVVTRVVAK